MKKILTLTLALVLALSLAACGGKDNSSSTGGGSKAAGASGVTGAATSGQSSIAPIQPKLTEYSFVGTTYQGGYKLKFTFKISQWLKPDDANLLAYWVAIGGGDTLPIHDGLNKYNGGDGNFYSNNGAFLLGTLSIENVSDGFDIKDGANINPWLNFNVISQAVESDKKTSPPKINYISFVSGSYNAEAGINEVGFGTGRGSLALIINANTLGPLPFAIAISSEKTPENPMTIDEIISGLQLAPNPGDANGDGTIGMKAVDPADLTISLEKSW